MRGQPGHNTRPHAQSPQFPGHGSMDDLTTERSFDSQGTWISDGLVLIFDDMIYNGVCSTSHWQTSGRLMQELNVCTVYEIRYVQLLTFCHTMSFLFKHRLKSHQLLVSLFQMKLLWALGK